MAKSKAKKRKNSASKEIAPTPPVETKAPDPPPPLIPEEKQAQLKEMLEKIKQRHNVVESAEELKNLLKLTGQLDAGDPLVAWCCDEGVLPGNVRARSTRYWALKNAFFRNSPGNAALAANPGYAVANPGGFSQDYADIRYIFQYLTYVRSLDWVQAIAARTTLCQIVIPLPGSDLCMFPITNRD